MHITMINELEIIDLNDDLHIVIPFESGIHATDFAHRFNSMNRNNRAMIAYNIMIDNGICESTAANARRMVINDEWDAQVVTKKMQHHHNLIDAIDKLEDHEEMHSNAIKINNVMNLLESYRDRGIIHDFNIEITKPDIECHPEMKCQDFEYCVDCPHMPCSDNCQELMDRSGTAFCHQCSTFLEPSRGTIYRDSHGNPFCSIECRNDFYKSL